MSYTKESSFSYKGKGKSRKSSKRREQSYQPRPAWAELSEIYDYSFIDKVESQTVTIDDIEQLEFTCMLRAAHYNYTIQKILWNEREMRGVPFGKNFKLFSHQVEAIQYMKDRESIDPHMRSGITGGMLNITTGGGKSLIVATHSLSAPRGKFPTLIVVTKTLLNTWKVDTFEKYFGPRVKVLFFHAEYNPIHSFSRGDIIDHDFVVTTYDALVSACNDGRFSDSCVEYSIKGVGRSKKIISMRSRTEMESDDPHAMGLGLLYCTPWERVIFDESQVMCNFNTQVFLAGMVLYARYKWVMTATPIKNSPTDIWSQFRCCGYNTITKPSEWLSRHVKEMEKLNKTSKLKIDLQQTDIELPQCIPINYEIYFSAEERVFYDFLKSLTVDSWISRYNGNATIDGTVILALFTLLRQCSVAPYLVTDISKRKRKVVDPMIEQCMSTFETIRDRLSEATLEWLYDINGTAGIRSAKITKILDIIREIPEDDKIIIFTVTTSCLDLISHAILTNFPNKKLVKVDGDVSGANRSKSLSMFTSDSSIQILLTTTGTTCTGVNLTAANRTIFAETWWEHTTGIQARDRTHRWGQTKETYFYEICVADSIDVRVNEIIAKKAAMAESMLNNDDSNDNTKQLFIGEVLEIIKYDN